MFFPYRRSKNRNRRSELYCNIGVLKNMVYVTGTHICRSFFSNKVAEQSCNALKKETLFLT